MDSEQRALERAAASGDVLAKERLNAIYRRSSPRLLDVGYDWHEDYGNRPTFTCKLSWVPSIEDLVFERRAYLNTEAGIYYASLGDFVQYLSYTRPGQGFGGAVYKLKMQDGSTQELKGPWSGRASVANQVGFPHCVEASDASCRSVAVLVASLLPICKAKGIQVFRVMASDGEISYEPGRDGRRKERDRGDNFERVV